MKPYADNAEHLLDELKRLDLMLAVHLDEWRVESRGTIDEFQGLYVSDEEVDTLLRQTDATSESSRNEQRNSDVAQSTDVTLGHVKDRVRNLRDRERKTIAEGTTLRFVELSERFDLYPLHRDALLIGLGPEFDRKYERIYSYLQDDVTKKRPTVDLILRVLCRSEAERLEARTLFSRRSPLVRNRLLSVSGGEETPLLSRFVRVDERITNYLLGNDGVADELAEFVATNEPTDRADDLVVDEAQREALEELSGELDDRGGSKPLFAYFYGPHGAGKEIAVEVLCRDNGVSILKVDAERISERDLREPIRLVSREALLQGTALYIRGLGALSGEREVELEAVIGEFDEFDGHVFLAGTDPLSPKLYVGVTNHQVSTLRFSIPSYEARRERWSSVNSLPGDVDPADLAAKFRLTGGQIEDAVALAGILANGDELSAESVYEGCRAQSSVSLDSLARKIDPNYIWDDIVLPMDDLNHLREVATRVTYQGTVYSEWGFEDKFSLGNGLNVLFTGPPGTGKTMAAEIIAGDAGLDLYKIDLSSVVSKYIGETEKNLGKVFDEAENSSAILLFDEADALFGKRSKVKDSHDRYANIEVNYLLQRIEEHDGTVILTTNFKQNIDDAFLRRIHMSVEFPLPDRESRAAIWEKVFPEATPLAELDYGFLATFDVTGGNIKNIALTAAFLAADDAGEVEMKHVLRAAWREFQKTGKLVAPEEFGAYRSLLNQ